MNNMWEPLTQEAIIDAVEKVTGQRLTSLCLKRNSYINRVFELEEESGKRLIIKFYRPGRWTKAMILEEHAFIKELLDLDNHVIPPIEYSKETLFEYKKIYFSLFQKKGGRALDEFDQDGWINIGRIIGKMHLAGAAGAVSKRLKWMPSTATKNHVKTLTANNVIPEDFLKPFNEVSELLIKNASPAFETHEQIKLHGDIHMGNFIHRPGEGTFVVDFDDMCTGPAVQDMWMLLPDTVDNSKQEINWFIEGYETFKSFDRSSLELIPYLRAMRMIHFAAWCAIQKDDAGFETHFPEWGTKKYWGQLIRDIGEGIRP